MNPDEHLNRALQALPHGAEFRFVDRLTRLEAGKSGSGEYTVRGDEPMLRGHFPGDPMFPGVMLVEAVAQLAGVVAQSDPQIAPIAGLKLAALQNVKIWGTARPGETIRLEARIAGRLGRLIQAQGTAHLAEQTILTAELTLSGNP